MSAHVMTLPDFCIGCGLPAPQPSFSPTSRKRRIFRKIS
jgi:hypothetical protein